MDDSLFQIQKKISEYEDLNMTMLNSHPWAKDMWEKILDIIQKGFLNWCKIVINVGDKENLSKWIATYLGSIEDITCELVDDIAGLQQKLISKIENSLQSLQEICRNLHVEMPVIGNQQLSLFDEQNELKNKIREYEQTMEVRKKELQQLRSKQLELCESLGKQPKIIADSPLPSSAEIADFQKHIDNLESERFERLEKFFVLKGEIIDIMNELNIKPCSPFEKEVVTSDNFLVTSDNMKELEKFHDSLQKQLKSVKEEIEHLQSKVNHLWNMIETDMMERELFKQRHKGNTLDTLEALRVEAKRCEEIKKVNIKVFVDKLREELTSLWDNCQLNEGQRGFRYFKSDCYTEDLLELHEIEVAKWKKYYEENKDLLNSIVKHRELWEKLLEFEEKKTGPERYKNRGGQLLREEKERNKLSKYIPQLEDNIMALAQNYELHYGTEFTTYGQTVVEYISDVHEDLENKRKLKSSARKQQQAVAITPGKSAISLFPSTSTAHLATPTPLSATKRKNLATPLTENKKQKTAGTPKSGLKSKYPIPTITVTHTSYIRHKRLSGEKKKAIRKILRRSGKILTKFNAQQSRSNDTTSTEYVDFQNELSSRADCRSTILPHESLIVSPIKATLLRTPIKTTPRNLKTPLKVKQMDCMRTPTPKSPNPLRTTPKSPMSTTKMSTCQKSLKLLF